MKSYPFFLLLFLAISCKHEKGPASVPPAAVYQKIETPAFQTILDSADVNGAILILDASTHQYYSNDFTWCEKGQLPASTFKIPNSIIALETKVVEDDSTIFKWDGEDRYLKTWEQDLTFRDAFKYSCVPCYQEVARGVRVERMKEYVDKLDYGNILVDSTNIDLFWLSGNSRITPFQQIDFLKRFYQSELPISKRTEKIVKDIMVLYKAEGLKISGKTGWSVVDEKNNGWLVGYVEKEEKVYYFATNVEPNPSFDMELFAEIRKEVTFKALLERKILK